MIRTPAAPGSSRWSALLAVAAAGIPLAVSLATQPIGIAITLPYLATGAVLVARRPRNVTAWLLVATGWSLTAGTFPVTADPVALAAGTAPFVDRIPAWLAGWGFYGALGGLAALTLVFPEGRLPRGRLRPVAAIALLLAVALSGIEMFRPTLQVGLPSGGLVTIPNVFSPPPLEPVLRFLPDPVTTFGLLIGLALVAIGMLVPRYRTASDTERAQVRWFAASLALAALATFIGLAGALATGTFGTDPFSPGSTMLPWLPSLFAYPLVPLSILIAVLRYRLYAIDRIISRTVAWSVVTAVVVATFVGMVVGLQTLLRGVTGESAIPVAISTLASLVLIQPLRRRVQEAVDRRFDRARYDRARVVEAFGNRLRTGVDLDALRDEIGRVAFETVRPSTASLWLRGSRPSAAAEEP